MKPFEVLNRNQDLHHPYLIEASAGTGKTFSIENAVARLLIEGDAAPPIERMLIVTFTRAATYDLKTRIRSNLEKVLSALDKQQCGVFDYLDPIICAGSDRCALAKRQIERALFSYDQAHILTIHSFCSRMLRDNLFESQLSLDCFASEEDQIPNTVLKAMVRDFFRTEINEPLISAAQLDLIMRHHKNCPQTFEDALLRASLNPLPIAKRPSYEHLFQRFLQAMHRLKEVVRDGQAIIDDYQKLEPHYKKLQRYKDSPIALVSRFARLFDKKEIEKADFEMLIADKLYLADFLQETNRKKKTKPICVLHIPRLRELLNQELVPIMEEAATANAIFACLAEALQKQINQRLEKEEKVRFDDYLKMMKNALSNPEFMRRIQNLFDVAIIDEFQDTDPLQWEIFRRLFDQKKHFFLVGDPKQSIYAFRSADIYTYLAAAGLIGEKNQASLNTNYRSTPELVNALNTLFSSENAPGLMALPRLHSALCYQAVSSAQKKEASNFHDGKKDCHFFIAELQDKEKAKDIESERIYPAIANEIQQLKSVSLNDIAILVSDRHQATAVASVLKEANIPCKQQRSESLAESPALAALKDVIKGIANPRHESRFKTALGSPIIGFNCQEILSLNDIERYEELLALALKLKKILTEEGFTPFFYALLNSVWKADGSSLRNRILEEEEGIDFYLSLTQIADVIMEFQATARPSCEQLIDFLDNFTTLDINDDERIKKRTDPNCDAVHILTIHASKGLEYAVVFALGVITRKKPSHRLYPRYDTDGTGELMACINDESESYYAFLDECDAEKIRRFYVAATRAKKRLYLPVILSAQSKVKRGEASAMDLYLSHLGNDNPLDYASLYERIRQPDCEGIKEFIYQQDCFSSSKLSMSVPLIVDAATNQAPALIPPTAPVITALPVCIESFSSLTAHHISTSLGEELKAPATFFPEEKNVHTLPSGSETGNLLHAIFEDIAFDCDAIPQFIKGYIEKTPYEPWEETIASLIETTLLTDLGGFNLKEISSTQIYKEAEFLYMDNDQLINESTHDERFIKGFIDLCFYHKKRYYLLDWKSNWLGPDDTYYEYAYLEKAMQSHRYDLQAKIYKNALKRYLALIDHRPFEEIFGGTYYLFLRGLRKNGQTGVYFQQGEHK